MTTELTDLLPEHLETSDKWPEILSATGKRPVRDVARSFGVPVAALQAALRRTQDQRKRRLVRPEKAAAPRRAPAKKQKPRTRTRTKTKTKTKKTRERSSPAQARVAKHHKLVGKVADREIAKKAGVSVGTVRNYRRAEGIKGAPRTAAAKTPTRPKRASAPSRPPAPPPGASPAQDRIAAHHDLVGVAHDREVADKAGVGLSSVRAYRRKHGIAAPPRPGWEVGVDPTPVPAPAAAPVKRPPARAPRRPKPVAAPVGRSLWQVLFGGDPAVRYVVGADLVEAARTAMGAGLGEVVEIERVGPVL